MNRDYMLPGEVARALDVHVMTLRKIPQDVLPHHRTGGKHRRYRRSDVLDYLAKYAPGKVPECVTGKAANEKFAMIYNSNPDVAGDTLRCCVGEGLMIAGIAGSLDEGDNVPKSARGELLNVVKRAYTGEFGTLIVSELSDLDFNVGVSHFVAGVLGIMGVKVVCCNGELVGESVAATREEPIEVDL